MLMFCGQKLQNILKKEFKMKKILWMVGCLWMGAVAFGQHGHGDAECECPSCLAKQEGVFTLPGLKGLSPQQEEHAECEHDHEEVPAEDEESCDPEGHDHSAHAEKPEAHDDHDDDHEGHDHATEETACSGHEEPEGLNLSAEQIIKSGIQVAEATSGVISKSVVFPAEIELNSDRSAAVSPRYASVVRQVFVEIGDEVRKGDILASLENRESLSVYTVAAPLSGVVVAKDASIGESASEDRVLFQVADLSSVWADISIFPTYRHDIIKGQAVVFEAHDGHVAHGTIQYISPLVSHETRTFTARCVLEGAADDFTPGAFVRARIVTDSAQVAVRVEREAVQHVAGESVVFIQDEHGFESRAVQVGLTDDRFVEVKTGLLPGERYVAVGAFVLKAEMVTSGMDPHAGHGH